MFAAPAAFPGSGTLARRSGRAGLGVFAALLISGTVTRFSSHPTIAVLGTIVALGAAFPFFVLGPRVPVAYALVATAGVVMLDAKPGNVCWFALVVLAIWSVMSAGLRDGLIYWAAAMVLFGAEWLVVFRDPGWGNWVAGVTLSALAASLLRHELVLVDRLRAAQSGLAERSRAEERNRIARELHDVIAHSLTVSLLHVSSARLAVEHDPADAMRSLAEAERLGRQSLDEVRATMGMLRPLPGAPIARPAPVAEQVTHLVQQLREAGADVALLLEGRVESLPSTLGSTVYRIVQEALTNATRHAPGMRVLVRLTVDRSGVEVEVDSAGRPGHGSGLGLLGMQERAEAVGGTCRAGPGGGGWRVHAFLPRPDGPEVVRP